MACKVALAMVVLGGASACSGGSDLLNTVVSIAPKCFDACPDVCKPLDKLIQEFTKSGTVAKDAICGGKTQLDCAFGDAYAECEAVLSMGSSIGIDLPTTVAQWTDFRQGCGPSSSGGFLSTTQPGTEGAEESESSKVDEESPEQPVSNESSASSNDVGTSVGMTEAPAACNPEDPIVSFVMSLSPTCFVRCPALCAAVQSQASHMGDEVPDTATVKKQVCASQDMFACAVQAAHLTDCQAVLSAGSDFGLPQSSADLSRLCGQGGHDIMPGLQKPVQNSANKFASPAGLSAALLAWMMLQ